MSFQVITISSDWRTGRNQLQRACIWLASALFETAVTYPQATWREVGMRHGLPDDPRTDIMVTFTLRKYCWTFLERYPARDVAGRRRMARAAVGAVRG